MTLVVGLDTTRSVAPAPRPAAGTSAVAGRFPHLAALDGLRGVAVALVVAYHLAPSAVPGGFLGVDVFFVLSGFLITSLLVDEVTASGRIDLGAFYVRRLRRLAPALVLLLAAVSAYAAVWATVGELSRIREHALWALGYLANWKLIVDGTTYTDVVAGASPLRHTWSLAIEEQFYVLFPVLVLALGRAVRWAPSSLRRALLSVAVLGTVASTLWMAVLWGDGGDPSRGYFGTDTRAHSLFVGVGLGAVLVGRPPRVGRAGAWARWAGTVGVAILALAIAVSDEGSPWLQHGGFLVVALSVAGVIAALERSSWLRRSLSVRPLVALGAISYGVYLWHWPIIVLMDDARTGVEGPALAVLRLSLTLAAATTSYRVLERPIRQGVLGRRLGGLAPLVAPATAVALVALVLAATALPPRPAVAPLARSAPPSAAPAERAAPGPDALLGVTPPTPLGRTRPAVAPLAPAAPASAAPADPARPGSGAPLGVVLLGDSVAYTLAGGVVGAFPDFEPWSVDLSPFDPARVVLQSVAKPACSYLPGSVVVEGNQPADLSPFCTGWPQDLAEALAAQPGATVVVALANDASDRRIGARTVRLGSEAHEELLAAFLDEVRDATIARGGTLALLALPPRTGSFALDIDDGGERERLMRAELRSYASSRGHVVLLDLFEQICPAADCRAPASGFDPDGRYDGMHYTPEGARWVADWITAQLTRR